MKKSLIKRLIAQDAFDKWVCGLCNSDKPCVLMIPKHVVTNPENCCCGGDKAKWEKYNG